MIIEKWLLESMLVVFNLEEVLEAFTGDLTKKLQA